ncbi:hypothetical protein C8R43DRAFT_1133717 [Mycena crocata]|nr:hypothetical protein C8R43DRAFT_1133717 [Mycena crocata]
MFQSAHIPPPPGEMVTVYIRPPVDAVERLLRECVGPPRNRDGFFDLDPCINGGDHVFSLNKGEVVPFRLAHWQRECLYTGDKPPCPTQYDYDRPHPAGYGLRIGTGLFKQYYPLVSELSKQLSGAEMNLASLWDLQRKGTKMPNLPPREAQLMNHVSGYCFDPEDLIAPEKYRTLHDPDVDQLEKLNMHHNQAGALIRAVIFSEHGKRPNERLYDPAHFLLVASNPPCLDLTYYDSPDSWPARQWHRGRYELFSPASGRYEAVERVQLGLGRVLVYREIGVDARDCLRINMWERLAVQSANNEDPSDDTAASSSTLTISASSSRTNAVASTSTIAPSASSSHTNAVASSSRTEILPSGSSFAPSRSTIADFFAPSVRTVAVASTSAITATHGEPEVISVGSSEPDVIYVGSSEPNDGSDSDVEIVDAYYDSDIEILD